MVFYFILERKKSYRYLSSLFYRFIYKTECLLLTNVSKWFFISVGFFVSVPFLHSS